MANIVVIGGGIVGCMTALELNQQGHQVSVVERNQIAAQTSGEASWAGAGILFPLLPWMYKDEVNALALSGASLYPALCQRLLDETGIDPEYTQSGMLIQPAFDAALGLSWCAKNNIEAQQIGENLLLPQVAQVRPPHLLQALKELLIQQNVTLLESIQLEPLQLKSVNNTNKIEGWRTSAGNVLMADVFVVTSGAWSFELLKDTAAGLNVKPMRGQILLYDLSHQAASNLPANIIYQDGFYLVPRRDGLLLAGSTLEDVGFDTSTTEAMRQALQVKAENIQPNLKQAAVIKHWCGFRPGTPDNLPTIAQHPSIENLFLNTGHFRYGLTMAPASAERVAELILGTIAC
ncbi:MAG: FAD-dependent oxidoreductase [Methylophilaceae bacterium]